jgi:hypothetical protein
MIGEEAVTLDIVPLLRCMSDLGRSPISASMTVAVGD